MPRYYTCRKMVRFVMCLKPTVDGKFCEEHSDMMPEVRVIWPGAEEVAS